MNGLQHESEVDGKSRPNLKRPSGAVSRNGVIEVRRLDSLRNPGSVDLQMNEPVQRAQVRVAYLEGAERRENQSRPEPESPEAERVTLIALVLNRVDRAADIQDAVRSIRERRSVPALLDLAHVGWI